MKLHKLRSTCMYNIYYMCWFLVNTILNVTTASTPQKKGAPLESRQNINTSFAYPRYGVTSGGRLEGYFCSDTVFNLNRKVLTDTAIRILERGLDFGPIQNKINEPELRSGIEDFCRRMRTKWRFSNEPTPEFSETPPFSPKSTWKTPMGHPNVEVFLNQKEHEIFQEVQSPLGYLNLSTEEWKAVRSLANDRKSNRLFESLKRRQLITEKKFKYFHFEFKKTCNLGKLYLLPKLPKRLSNVHGRPVISNWGRLQKKYPNF